MRGSRRARVEVEVEGGCADADVPTSGISVRVEGRTRVAGNVTVSEGILVPISVDRDTRREGESCLLSDMRNNKWVSKV